MACGTGKSLIGLWVARALKAETILVVAPSLQLIQRAVEDWSKEYLAYDERPDWVCVCSDDTVTDDVDDFVTDTYESGLPTLIDPRAVAELLRGNGTTRIVFTTYQSSETVAEAARLAGVTFDLAIFDEAHKTVGRRDKAFGRLLRDDFKVKRRMFMTATERIVNSADDDEVYSMDNEEDYGKRFYDLEFGDAIELGLISPFQVVTITVSESRIKALIDRNRILNVGSGLKDVKARDLAIAVILNEAIERHGIKKAIAYCPSILAGKNTCKQQDALNQTGRWTETANFHVSSELTAGERADVIRKFEDATRPAIMYNARCLTEGVDIGTQKDRPVDAVAFTSPRRSVIDIVQAAGRAMRKGSRKKVGYVLIPIIVPDDVEFDKFAETTPFKEMARIIKALAIADPRIVDELRALYYGKVPTGKIIKIEGESIGLRMPFDEFASALGTRVWESVGRANRRSFDEARDFARKLGLKSHIEWWQWSSGKLKQPDLVDIPPDIPATPETVYSEHWKGWPDWLGYGPPRVVWRPFKEARAYARKLNLKSHKEWMALAKDRRLPDDIPASPDNVYDEWIGWWDWLGTPHRRGKWMPFASAKSLSQKVGIKSKAEFLRWHRGDLKHRIKCPADMPMRVENVYRGEFKGWPDFLGYTATVRMTFDEAKAFVRPLGLKNQFEFREWTAGRLRRPGLPARPKNLPTNPHRTYSSDWKGDNDFLGTPTPRNKRRTWRPFEEAREYVRSQKLASVEEYRKWTRGELKNRPKFSDDIPAWPPDVYGKEKNWKGFSDFMGSKPLAKYVQMWSFSEARDYESLRVRTNIANGRTADGKTFRKNLRKCPLNHG
jgi:superfamily II DNA or RNA helicase